MFKKLFNYEYERSFTEAIGFYLAYLIIVFLGGMLSGVILERLLISFGFELSYGAAYSFGNFLSIIVVIVLAALIMRAKNAIKHYGYLFIAITAALLAYYGGAIAGLFPVAYLSTIPKYKTDQEDMEFSNMQPVWQLIVLMIFTWGYYQFYWFYRNWKQLKEKNNLDIRPGWRMVGLLVPFYGLYLVYDQFALITQTVRASGEKKVFSAGWMFTLFLLTLILSPFLLYFPLYLLPLIFIQKHLNQCWLQQDGQKPVKKTLSAGEFIVILAVSAIVMFYAGWINNPSFPGTSENIEKKAGISMAGIYLPKVEYDNVNYITWKNYGVKRMNLPAELISAIYDRAIVTIYTYNGDGKELGSGSGFIINRQGFIITNKHVLKGAGSAKIVLNNGKVFGNAHLVNIDFGENVDVACIKINAAGLTPVLIGDSSEIMKGQEIYAFGSPQGFRGTVSKGIISAINYDRNIIQIDAPISRGSSGGPIVNGYGEVIGIVTAFWGADQAQNINFAIPINAIK